MPIARDGFTRRKSDIDTTPSQLINQLVNAGVQILASPNNSEPIYVGYNNAITANSADDTDGFRLAPGTALFLPCRNASDIWVRSTSAGSQVIWYIGQ